MRSHSPARTFASAADRAVCGRLLRGGSRTFRAASLVLPPRVRRAATGLYAFCRTADDAIDQGLDRHAALEDLRARLDAIYAATPGDDPVDRVFADVVLGYDIPRAFPDALLEGFEWDAADRRYESLAELTDYAVRVAGVVGAMMAMVMGVRDPGQIARACDLGVAMQLTNIARDVGEDARCRRLYLPLEWLREEAIDPAVWCSNPEFNAGVATVIRRLLVEADALYERSEVGLAGLPAACRPGMYAARLLYAEIGHELGRRELDSVNRRAIVSWRRKARLVARAVVASGGGRGVPATVDEILPQALFLLVPLRLPHPAAVIVTAPQGSGGGRGVGARVVWVMDLFERLERRDHSPGTVPDVS